MFKDKIRIIDVKAILIFSFIYIPSIIYKIFNKKNWLFSERGNDARDNGYALFKHYYDIKHLKKRYLITKDSPDIYKFNKTDRLVFRGTIKHYIVYMFSYIHASAHVDSDSPNPRVTNFLKRHHLLFCKRVFLQHGITKDRVEFCFKKSCLADIFITSAYPEYEFVKNEFGYKPNVIKLTGLARYDKLISNPKNQILIMPTWRCWLKDYNEDEFMKSRYYLTYSSLIKNAMLLEVARKNGLKIVFYLHHDMQKFSHLFMGNDVVKIGDEANYDVQTLLIESNLLISDYSSVPFDFAYMKKPLIYYHFDYADYSNFQNNIGYFDYERDGLGKVIKTEEDLINEINKIVEEKFIFEDEYEAKRIKFYKYFDLHNCDRIYNEIISLIK